LGVGSIMKGEPAMSETLFHIGLAPVYAAMAFEAWTLRHSRMACCYALAAYLAVVFAVGQNI
jgi:hypothetical protein